MFLNGLLQAKLNKICIGDIISTSNIKPDFCRNETNKHNCMGMERGKRKPGSK